MSLDLLHELNFALGQRLRSLRKLKDIPALEVAERLVTTRQQLYRYERGKNPIPAAKMVLAAECFGVSLSAFDLTEEDYRRVKRKAAAREAKAGRVKSASSSQTE